MNVSLTKLKLLMAPTFQAQHAGIVSRSNITADKSETEA